ncbi:MAG: L,D-transpeptidase [Chloroflexota bacterium]|nr:L,D-transpeptidase [Chloroflexota bacterium]
MRTWFYVALCLLCVALPAAAQDAPAYGLPERDILRHPAPTLERLLTHDTILYRGNYRQVIGALEIYDAPDGVLIDTQPEGTYFVTVYSFGENGWVEINPGEWVREAQLAYANTSRLTGALLNDGTPYPAGWVTHVSRPSRVPGEASIAVDAAAVPYEFVYVYAEVTIGEMTWAQIGVERWIDRTHVSVIKPIERHADISGERWVGVDLNENVLIAYEGTTPVFAALVATGVRTESTQTDVGIHTVYARFVQGVMSNEPGVPWFYYIEDVPYTFYFNGHEALHGAYWHDEFGRYRSHGCVNLTMTDAYWLYNWLSDGYDFLTADAARPMVWVYR